MTKHCNQKSLISYMTKCSSRQLLYSQNPAHVLFLPLLHVIFYYASFWAYTAVIKP